MRWYNVWWNERWEQWVLEVFYQLMPGNWNLWFRIQRKWFVWQLKRKDITRDRKTFRAHISCRNTVFGVEKDERRSRGIVSRIEVLEKDKEGWSQENVSFERNLFQQLMQRKSSKQSKEATKANKLESILFQALETVLHAVNKQTLVMGPWVGRVIVSVLPDCWDLILETKGVMLWETPSAKVNCSRSSTLVFPLAEQF